MIQLLRKKAPIMTPDYEWLCPCGQWHSDNTIEHGYFQHKDAKETRLKPN